MENELDKRDDIIQEKNDKIEELMQKLEKISGLSNFKKLYEDLVAQNEMDFKKVCQFIIENKTKL